MIILMYLVFLLLIHAVIRAAVRGAIKDSGMAKLSKQISSLQKTNKQIAQSLANIEARLSDGVPRDVLAEEPAEAPETVPLEAPAEGLAGLSVGPLV
ncbi:MAG: hypothetical protein FWH50_00445 [Coriobacteriia bacterium]|nr:hypothetical protein [Coriobacteriia bacterium]